MRILISILLAFIVSNLASAQSVKMSSKRNEDNSVELMYEKEMYGSFYVVVKFNRLENSLNKRIAKVVSGQRGRLACLKPMDSNKWIDYSYTYRSMRGNPNTRIDKDFTYLLPFEKNTEVYVRNLNNLGNHHFDEKQPKNWTAYQFYTNGEQKVLAVRKGLVVKVVDEFKTDTTQTYSFKRSKNEVLIEHADGSLASYKGLKRGSISVKEGQHVNPNDELGLSDRYDKKNKYEIRFCIYYLNKKGVWEVDSKEKKAKLYAYIKPLFFTKKGKSFLEMRKTVVAECTEELIMQEFSRREKKRYLKAKLQ